MRQYQPIVAKPIEANQPREAKNPPRRSIHRPEPPESPGDAGPVAESPRVLARIPDLADEGAGSGSNRDDGLREVGSRGSRLSLKILAGGIIVLLAVALKPLVWPLVSGNKTPTTATNDELPRWPTTPPANSLSAPKPDAKTSLPTTWQTGNVRAEPGQPEEPNSEEIPGISTSPWDQPANAAPRRDPMPWRTQASQPGASEPANWPAPDAGPAPQRNPRQYSSAADLTVDGSLAPRQPDRWQQRSADRGESPSQYRPSYRTATRPQYDSEPRLPARVEDRPDGMNATPPGSYPQFTNPDVRPDRSPWRSPPDSASAGRYRDQRPAPGYQDGLPPGSSSGDQPAWDSRNLPPPTSYRSYSPATGRREPVRPTNSPGLAPRWDYPSTDRTGREPPPRPSWDPSAGSNPAFGDDDSTADPGAARLEGYIERPNVRTSYERTRPSVY